MSDRPTLQDFLLRDFLLALIDFLLARLDEREADAIAVRDCEMFHGVDSDAEAEVLRLCDPADVLADVEAKRRTVETCRVLGSDSSDSAWWSEDKADAILCAPALPYADHPDYREEWRP